MESEVNVSAPDQMSVIELCHAFIHLPVCLSVVDIRTLEVRGKRSCTRADVSHRAMPCSYVNHRVMPWGFIP